MSHNHHHHHHHSSGSNALTFAFFLNLGFSVIELIGGILTNSTAIVADAFHDFMDAMAIGVAVYFEKISKKKRTDQFLYGYRRFNLVSALGLSVVLLVGAAVMVYSAVLSFQSQKEVHSLGMLGLAILGVLVNGAAFLRLKNDDETNNNRKAVMLHILEDVLGWIAVLIGSIVIYFTNWNWIDGLLAIGIAGFISINAVKNIIDTMKIMLQSVPENIDMQQLSIDIRNIDEVIDFHDLRIWTMDGNYHVGSLHVQIPTESKITYAHLYEKVQAVLSNYHIEHATIQVETLEDNCLHEEEGN
ncbi:MAG TPA: cation diffusion facilitator family transporter [Chitinophagales bacterium]|nr:cation diffusion facilitator family transporter [Chitinophagales bacterium]